MKNLVILGTARDDSNTKKAVEKLCPFKDYELIELHQLQIQPYTYNSTNDLDDDFLAIAMKMQNADHIIFATPVYWYSMSAQLKVFFDRLTDLLYQHKAIGRSLKGKKVYLIVSGADAELPEGFEVPFRRTAEYFEMKFQKSFYEVTK